MHGGSLAFAAQPDDAVQHEEAVGGTSSGGVAARRGSKVKAAKHKVKAAKHAPAGPVAGADAGGSSPEQDEEEAEQVAVPKKKRQRKEYLDIVITVPDPAAAATLAASGQVLPPLPVPNLGYACLNQTLRGLRSPVFTNRDCVKKTFEVKGLEHISSLALQNVADLPKIIQWNDDNGIRLFRLSSCLVPWMSEVKDLRALPDFEQIAAHLKHAGDLARAYGQRLTFHPSHFVKLAAPNQGVLDKSIIELEMHSQIFDVMGYEPSPWNKINIHIGGVYDDKAGTLLRFEQGFARLSAACRQRLTVENDDTPNAFSLSDLLPLAQRTSIPLVFDFHHYKFVDTPLSEKDSLLAAVSTWPAAVRPVVHWSESQEGRIPKAHSDYVDGPIRLHGLQGQVDVMIEAKCKEVALLRYRQLQQQEDVQAS